MINAITVFFQAVTLACIIVLALFIYAAYNQPEMIEEVSCMIRTNSDFGYTACRLMND